MKNYIPIAKPVNELNEIKNFSRLFSDEIQKGYYVGGPNVVNFEDSLVKFLKVKYAVSLNSGTDALILSLKALGVKSGDEVILPSFTYYATAEAVMQCNAKPVFADVEKDSFCISLETLEPLVNRKTKCIIPVHLYGYDADISNINQFAKEKNISLIEDAAQAFGSKSVNGKFLGTYGDINAFSNFPSKTLGGIGDGGFVSTNNYQLYKKISLLKNHGQSKIYEHEIVGYNSRMDSLNAFVLNEKLKKFSEIKKTRNKFVDFYIQTLKEYDFINFPKIDKESTLLNYFTIILPSKIRFKLQEDLVKEGIQTNIYYRKPLHKQKALKDYGYKSLDLQRTENLGKRVLSLPLYSHVTKNELDYISSKLKKVLKKYG